MASGFADTAMTTHRYWKTGTPPDATWTGQQGQTAAIDHFGFRRSQRLDFPRVADRQDGFAGNRDRLGQGLMGIQGYCSRVGEYQIGGQGWRYLLEIATAVGTDFFVAYGRRSG